jgi:hypothetical protein
LTSFTGIISVVQKELHITLSTSSTVGAVFTSSDASFAGVIGHIVPLTFGTGRDVSGAISSSGIQPFASRAFSTVSGRCETFSARSITSSTGTSVEPPSGATGRTVGCGGAVHAVGDTVVALVVGIVSPFTRWAIHFWSIT